MIDAHFLALAHRRAGFRCARFVGDVRDYAGRVPARHARIRGRSTSTEYLRSRWSARSLFRLSDLDQVTVGIADVRTNLRRMVLRLGEEPRAARRPVAVRRR